VCFQQFPDFTDEHVPALLAVLHIQVVCSPAFIMVALGK
jgi:hypothetical protein